MKAKPLGTAIRIAIRIGFLGALLLASPASAKVAKGDRAARFVAVTDGSGKKVSLKGYKNQIVVLTFGASWCKPCRKELPAFEKLAAKYPREKVIFMAVNIDGEKAKGATFMKKAGLNKVLALFDTRSSTVKSYDPKTMPTTYVIKKGIVRHVHAGYRSGDAAKLQKTIGKLL